MKTQITFTGLYWLHIIKPKSKHNANDIPAATNSGTPTNEQR